MNEHSNQRSGSARLVRWHDDEWEQGAETTTTPAPGKKTLTAGLAPRALMSTRAAAARPGATAAGTVVQRKANDGSPGNTSGNTAANTSGANALDAALGLVDSLPAAQNKRAPTRVSSSTSSAVIQRSPSVDDQWEDATAGLTQRQAGALSTALTWTGNIFSHAVMPKPPWELLLTQCDMIEGDITGIMTSDITTRAAATLAPAVTALQGTRGYIKGAHLPESEVRSEAARRLSSANTALSSLIEDGVWVDNFGAVRVNSDEDIDALLEASRPTPAADDAAPGEDGGNGSRDNDDIYPYTIKGTDLEITSEEGEDTFRQDYKPLTSEQKGYATRISKLMVKDFLSFDTRDVARQSKLKDMETSLRGARFLLDDMMKDGVGAQVQARLEVAKLKLEEAHKMVVGKLAADLPTALGNIQSGTVGIESAIRNTLALRPFKHDPDWPMDMDGDGMADERPHLSTRGLRRDDQVTRIYPESSTGNSGGDSPPTSTTVESDTPDTGGTGDELVIPAVGGV